MPQPLTRSQVERLGDRLIAGETPDAKDLARLHELLAAYDSILSEAGDRVRLSLSVSPTSRIKNTGTILEKLRRYGGSWLKSMQDLAGMRIVGDFDRHGQDTLVAQLVELFAVDAREPKVVDRRAHPVQGYRAVHIIVFPHQTPIEIQVRTRRQHDWAELFEKLADRFGRGIRYGEPPAAGQGANPEAVVRLAISMADAVSQLEIAEAEFASPQLQDVLRQADETFASLRELLVALSGASTLRP